MFYFLLAIQALLCLLMIGLVLLQQGKGADMGAAFGGGSNTLFGAGGAGSFISKLTTGTCVAFMITSILLIKAYQNAGAITLGQSSPLAGSVMQTVAEKVEAEKAEAAKAAAANSAALPPVKSADAVAPAPVQAPAQAAPEAAAKPEAKTAEVPKK